MTDVTSAPTVRIEQDSMGPMEIPGDMLYGASTQRAVENFPISGIRLGRSFIKAVGQVKASCARVNMQIGKLDTSLGEAILAASVEVREGQHDVHFVVDVFQTGSGTSTNMNANEVISNLANLAAGGKVGEKKPVHPNDHVNMGQSSNDIIPTAMHVAALCACVQILVPELKELQASLEKKAQEFSTVYKTGRTHLQDAMPVTLGQQFSGYARQVELGIQRVEATYSRLKELPIGGTAVGTGINTPKEFGRLVAEDLTKDIGIEFVEAANHFEAQACKDACVELSGALKTIAASFTKIANDIRWMASGPRCGLGEIRIPATQPGSSIMPGKINPVMSEAMVQVAAQVMGNDVAVNIGGATGNFELNVMMPLITHNLLQSIDILAGVSKQFRIRCVDGIEADEDACQATIEKNLSLVTALNPKIGYDNAGKLAKQAYAEGKNIRETAKASGLISDADVDEALDVKKMV